MLDERQAIERAQRGDKSAFEQLVRLYQHHLLAFAAGMLRDRDEARDAVQEAFVQAFLNLARFDPRRSFRSWLLGIAAKRCLDRLRKRRRFGDFFRRAGRSLDPEAERGGDPAGGMEAAELLGRLPPRERVALWLQLAAGCSAAEIAGVLGCAESTVRVHLFNARRRLHKEVTADV